MVFSLFLTYFWDFNLGRRQNLVILSNLTLLKCILMENTRIEVWQFQWGIFSILNGVCLQSIIFLEVVIDKRWVKRENEEFSAVHGVFSKINVMKSKLEVLVKIHSKSLMDFVKILCLKSCFDIEHYESYSH